MPLRFLNLLPLSHMFGQSMATNIPPMVRRHRHLHAQLQPARHRAADQALARLGARVRAEDSRRAARARAARRSRSAATPPPQGISIPARWWRYRADSPAFGLKFWAFVVGAAPLPPDARGVLAAHGVCRHPGLRTHRDRADRHAESPVQDQQGIGGHADRRRRGARSRKTARFSSAAKT